MPNRNKQHGTSYERRTVNKGIYGFRKWSSIGLFDVGRLDYVDGKLCFMLIQNKYSTIKKPYISCEEIQELDDFITDNRLSSKEYPWLWIGIFKKQAHKKEERIRRN